MSNQPIFILKYRAIGDSVIGLSTVQYLKELFPNTEVYYGVPSWIAPLYQNVQTAANGIIPMDLKGATGWWRLVKTLDEISPQSIFEMFQSGRTQKLFKLYKKLKKVPYYAHNHHKLIGHVHDQGVIKSNIQRDLDGAWTFYGAPQDQPIPNFLNYCPSMQALTAEDNSNQIIFGVVATRETKKWDLDNYITLAKFIEQDFPQYKIVIPLSKNKPDQQTKAYFLENLKSNNIEFLETSLAQLPLEIQGSRFYLGNDTGLKHIAIALGVKSFTLFGPEPPTEWHPYNKDQHPYFYIEGLECRTKDAHFCGLETCESMVCLKDIKVEDIYNSVRNDLV